MAFARRLWKILWTAGVGLIIAGALLLSVFRMALPYAAGYRAEIEDRLGSLIGQRVEIGALDARISGFRPEFRLQDLRLLDPAGRTLLAVSEVRVRLAWWASLRGGLPQPDRVLIEGTRLRLVPGSDGVPVLAGVDLPRGAGGVPPAALWLLQHGEVVLRDAEVEWSGAEPLRVAVQEGRLRYDGSHRLIHVRLRPPERYGDRFEFGADVEGDLLDPLHWRGTGYVRARGASLPALLALLGGAGIEAERGEADVEAWIDFRDAAVSGVTGEARIADARLRGRRSPALNVDQARARFAWGRVGGGWQLDLDRFEVAAGSASLGETRIGLRHETAGSGARIELAADRIALGPLATILARSGVVEERWVELLGTLAPAGSLRDLRARVGFAGPGGDEWPMASDYALEARFSELALRPWNGLPGIAGASGRIRMDEAGGWLALDAESARAELPGLFRAPIALGAVRGEVGWSTDGESWVVEAPAVTVRADGLSGVMSLHVAGGGTQTPVIDLQADFRDGRLDQARHYLPAHVMPAAVVEWLESGLRGGRVPRGSLIFHGPAGAFPFAPHAGLFEVRFEVRDGLLDYQADWPRVVGLDAEVVFGPDSVELSGATGQVFRAGVSAPVVRIASFTRAPALELELDARGSLSDGFLFLDNSPLGRGLDAVLNQWQADGPLELGLRLELPFGDAPLSVSGSATTRGANARWPAWHIALDGITGTARFTEAGLVADGIVARVEDEQVAVDAQVPFTDDAGEGYIAARGRTRIARWAGYWPEWIGRRVLGEADWSARIAVPAGEAGRRGAVVEIASDLVGVTVLAPEPAGKRSVEPMPLLARAEFGAAGMELLRLRYGGWLDTAWRLGTDADGSPRVQAGTVHLGGGSAAVPEAIGISVGGTLERLPLWDWYRWFGPVGGANGIPVQRVRLEAGTMALPVQDLHEVSIDLRRSANAWYGEIDAREARGSISVPRDFAGDVPLVAHFERLRIDPPATDAAPAAASGEADDAPVWTAEAPDPRALPLVQLSCEKFFYGDAELGAIEVKTNRLPDGVELASFSVQGEGLKVLGRGRWRRSEAGHESTITLDAQARELDRWLTRLGYNAYLRARGGQMILTVGWPDWPGAFDVRGLSGNARMRIDEGRVLAVAPGGGRALGLLSFTALPRRLLLDFTDVFGEGFAFDRIEGDVRIEQGHAHTDNLQLRGTAARIDIRGRMGLADRDYDERVTVTPRVSSALPVIGAITGGVATAAWLLFFERVFGTKIDESARIEYRVTGPWANPQVERLGLQRAPQAPAAPAGD